MKIEISKMYTTEEIVENKLFPYYGRTDQVNTDSYRQLILRAIRTGKIEAINTVAKGVPRYVISGQSLLNYLKNYGKPRITTITKRG